MGARWFGDGLGDKISDVSGLRCDDPSLTKQSDKDAADINNIMKRWERTGELPNMIARDPHWGDFSDVPTLMEAFAIVDHAEEQFENLDAQVRVRFANDPIAFAAFATDPKNRDELSKLGLLKPQDAPKPAEGAATGGKGEPAPKAGSGQ